MLSFLDIIFKIPFYGWCIKKLGFIGTHREKVTKDHLIFLEKTAEAINKETSPLILNPSKKLRGVKSFNAIYLAIK